MESPQKHFRKMLKSFKTAMLTTRNAAGVMHSRPMRVAESQEDGTLWFCTHLDSRTVDEITADPHVNVSMQGRSNFLSLTGTVEVVNDRSRVDELWNEAWRVWFPEGKDDANLCLLKVQAHEAEYWDQSGVQRLKFLAESARAYVTRSTPDYDREQHERIEIH